MIAEAAVSLEVASRTLIEDWDAYWTKELADDFWRRSHRMRSPISPFLSLVNHFENSWSRVLIVGCGISTEPALLARLGYEVVAFDVSSIAIKHVENHPASDEELGNWLTMQLPETAWERTNDGRTLALEVDARRDALRETLLRLAKPNGSLTMKCVNLRDFVVADRPFDVVYSPWSWQCLDDAGRAVLPRLAFEWLAPGGAAYFATQNLPPELYEELFSACTVAGLLRRHDEGHELLAREWPKNVREWERHNEVCNADDVTMRVQLMAGAKMWDVYRASG